jgi:hypothetical protein
MAAGPTKVAVQPYVYADVPDDGPNIVRSLESAQQTQPLTFTNESGVEVKLIW